MRKRLQINFFVIAALAILAVLSLTTIVFYNLFQNEVIENLQTCAHVLESNVDQLSRMDRETFQSREMNQVRVTLIDKEGGVLFDSNAEADKMENHKERPEVQEAFRNEEGKSIRKSSTLDKASFYYAVKVSDGRVLRVAKESESFWSFLIRVSPMIGGIAVILVLVSVILSRYLASSMVHPIEILAKNMDGSEPVTSYKELAPFIHTIQKQHEDIMKNSRLRQEFTANVSHELKTPLTSISGYSELIENGMATDSDTIRFAGEIHKNANRLLVLINDILQLSQMDSRDFSADFELVDLTEIVRECIDMLQLNAKKQGIRIEWKADVSFFVKGSPKMLEELVYNLIDNAIRYNKENGQVTVSLGNKENHIILSVKDTGIGICPENQERIFERFYRVDKSRSKETGGTGLGLAIVKHIVVCHNASIQVNSEEGKGTELIVSFEQANE